MLQAAIERVLVLIPLGYWILIKLHDNVDARLALSRSLSAVDSCPFTS